MCNTLPRDANMLTYTSTLKNLDILRAFFEIFAKKLSVLQ